MVLHFCHNLDLKIHFLTKKSKAYKVLFSFCFVKYFLCCHHNKHFLFIFSSVFIEKDGTLKSCDKAPQRTLSQTDTQVEQLKRKTVQHSQFFFFFFSKTKIIYWHSKHVYMLCHNLDLKTPSLKNESQTCKALFFPVFL